MRARLTDQLRISLLAWLATMLASLSLFPLFAQQSYLTGAAVVTLVVALVGGALRTLRLSLPLVLAAQVVVVVEWMVLTRASEQAGYGVLPTPAAARELGRLLSAGVEAANTYASPVPDQAGIMLLVALGIAAAALAVDLIAIGLNQVAWAGLPLLVLYTVPVATVPHGVPALAFLPGACGYVALLAAQERGRVGSWGKQITRTGQLWGGTAREQVSTAALAETGRRIGFTAIVLAVGLPMLLPAFSERLLSSGGAGGGPIMLSNPIVDLRRDLVQGSDNDVVFVRTTAPDPSYLRFTALDKFSGISWQPSVLNIPANQRARAGLPSPPGLRSSVRQSLHRYSVSVANSFSSTWLPEYYPTTSVRIVGDWRYDRRNLNIVSADGDTTTAGATYTLESVSVQPSVSQLQDAGRPTSHIRNFYTRLPTDLPVEVGQQAERVTGSATTDFERAVALQNWFRSTGGFTYSLKRPRGNSGNLLVDFLTKNRTGYCEQFAAAMALMARSLDIPSRVAIGFLHPQRQGKDYYVFSTHDLHSWPELYFEGVGWVRFEPTPATRTGGVPPYTSGVTSGPPTEQIQPNTRPPANQPGRDIVRRAEPGANAATASPAGSGDGSGLVWPAIVALVMLLVCLPAGMRVAVRAWRWRQAGTGASLAETAWSELRDTAHDLGVGWAGWLTPRGTARALRPHLGNDEAAEAALGRLVSFVERARYARDAGDAPDARADVEAVSRALRDAVSTGARWRAGLLSRSLLTTPKARWQQRQAAVRSRTLDGAASAARAGS